MGGSQWVRGGKPRRTYLSTSRGMTASKRCWTTHSPQPSARKRLQWRQVLDCTRIHAYLGGGGLGGEVLIGLGGGGLHQGRAMGGSLWRHLTEKLVRLVNIA